MRLPLPDDQQWSADRVTILQALGVLDPAGKPTARLDAVKAADLARLTKGSWEAERSRMLKTCAECHSGAFAATQLKQGDDMIRQCDHLMAQAIRTVAALYKDGVLPKPTGYAAAFPDLLTFHDAPTPVEHRMRAFQGTLHANPDYALWYGTPRASGGWRRRCGSRGWGGTRGCAASMAPARGEPATAGTARAARRPG